MLEMNVLRSLVTALLLGSASLASAGEVRMTGSTTTFLQVIQKYQAKVAEQTGATIKATGATTGKGLSALSAGQVEIALAADSLENLAKNAAEKGTPFKAEEYQEIYLKDSFLVCIVNKANKVNKLSEPQVRGLLSGDIKSWKDLGGADQPVVVIMEKESSANYALITKQLLGTTPLTKKATMVENVRHVSANVAELETAFGISPDFYLDEHVRIASDAKITQHLCLIIKKDCPSEVRKVAEAFASALKP